jgi:YesN/AraC family two-component response regulator
MKKLLSKINLLYVEDDDFIRPALQKALERKVKNLYVAKNGKEGLEKFLEFSPDIILTDIRMPVMDGLEMSEKIKKINPTIPIIMASAHSESALLLECIELGINDYLIKPIQKDKLLNMLVSNMKVILFNREKEKHQKLLQTVIDLQASIIFSYDDTKQTLFTNKLFLDFFDKEDIDDGKLLYEELRNNSDVRLLDVKEDISWIDYMFLHPERDFLIMINKNDIDREFLVKTKEVIEDDEKKIFVITLVEVKL